MIFNSLKEKCNFYRDLTDYRLLPNNDIMVMIDGKNFSKLVKNKFKKPFDQWFMNTMDGVAEHLCKNIQNCKGAYVQSDEISLIIVDNSETCSPFDGRICKLQSIIPAMATAYFNRELIKRVVNDVDNLDPKFSTVEYIGNYIDSMPDYVFDCKVWSVPNNNDALAWILYRNIDCMRNSKQQFVQTYIPHKQLMGKDTDAQVEYCNKVTGMDWNKCTNGEKYGRIIYKEHVKMTNPDGEEYIRSKWSKMSCPITDAENRSIIEKLFFKNNEQD